MWRSHARGWLGWFPALVFQAALFGGLKGWLKNCNGCGAFGDRVRGRATHPTLTDYANMDEPKHMNGIEDL